MLIDIESVRNLIALVGHPIDFCQTKVIPGNPSIGLPSRREVTKKKIKGYLAPSNVSRLILLNNTGNTKAEFTAYFTCKDINENDLKATTFLSFEGIYYQIEGIDTIYHEGVKIIYKYRLTGVPDTQGNFNS
jgi:hypothetical protein